MIWKNKKLLSALLILAVVAVVTIACFTLLPNPATESNSTSLTREKAARMILEEIKERKETARFGFDSASNAYTYNTDKNECMFELKKTGMIQVVKVIDYGGRRSYWSWFFQLTDKAKPFILEKDDSSVTMLLAKVISVEVTGLTAPTESQGQIRIRAELIAKREITLFGKAFGEYIDETLSGIAIFALYDDGWRLMSVYV